MKSQFIQIKYLSFQSILDISNKMTKTYLLALLLLVLVIPSTSSLGRQKLTGPLSIDLPSLLIKSYITNNVAIASYASAIAPSATLACFLLYVTLGTAPGGDFWVKVQTELDYHWTHGVGRGQDVWIENSEEFCLKVGPSKSVTLTNVGKISGENHGVSLYFTGYFQ